MSEERHPFYKNWVEGTLDGKRVLVYPKFNHPLIYRCKHCEGFVLFTSLEKLAKHVRNGHKKG